MGSYLTILLGVIVLGVLVDAIIPSGSTSKYISGIFAIFVLFVMISPILTWIKNDYKISDYFSSVDIELNEQLLYNITDNRFTAIESEIEAELKANGYSNVEVDIQFRLDENNVKITQVLVDLSKLVINQNSANINRYVYVRQVVTSKVAVSEEVVVFNAV